MNKTKMYRVINGEYKGRIGYCQHTKYGTVMFYPIEGMHPYRVCLGVDAVEEL